MDPSIDANQQKSAGTVGMHESPGDTIENQKNEMEANGMGREGTQLTDEMRSKQGPGTRSGEGMAASNNGNINGQDASNMPIEAVQKLKEDETAFQQQQQQHQMESTNIANVGKSIGDSHSDMYQMNSAEVEALQRSGMGESTDIVVGVNGPGIQALNLQQFENQMQHSGMKDDMGGEAHGAQIVQKNASNQQFFNAMNIDQADALAQMQQSLLQNNQQSKRGQMGGDPNMPQQKIQRNDPKIYEGEDHFKKLFTFIQRKVEYENFSFKHPNLLAVVIESINQKVTDNQRMFTHLYYRFHVSQDLTVGDLCEIMKFKMNCQIESHIDKISKKDKIIFFNENISVSEQVELRNLYFQKCEDDGWLYLDYLVEGYQV